MEADSPGAQRDHDAMFQAQEMQAKFFGGYEHSLDVKGRLTLPSKFRADLGDKCFVTRSQFEDSCLVVWTESDFYNYANSFQSQDLSNPALRRNMRVWASEAFDLEVDKAGRLALPQPLRRFAGLEREVLVHGAIGTIELWNPDEWNRIQEVSQ